MTSRKLVKLGRSSVVVSLPKDWLSDMDLKPGDEVLLRKEFDGSLRIFPLKIGKEVVQPDLIIDLDQCLIPGLLEKILKGGYLTGRERIFIKSEKGLSGEQLKEIRQIVEKVRGLEIIEQSINKIVLKSFIDPTKFKASLLFKRMSSLLTSMFEYLLRGLLEKNLDFIREIRYIYDEVYRIYLIMVRQFITCQINRELVEMIEFDNPLQLLEGRVITNYLNDIGYGLLLFAEDLEKKIDKLELKSSKVREVIEDIIKGLINIINEWLNRYIQKDLIGLHKVHELIEEKINRISKLLDYPWRAELDELTSNWIRNLLQTFLHIMNLFKNIVQASINTYIIKPPVGCAIISEK